MVKGVARQLILDTAEQLFAEQGVDAVSLRAINAAAGVSPGVLHYHFGNREVLLEALLERRMDVLMEQRRILLEQIDPQSPDLKDIITALVQPLADFVLEDGDEGKRYVQFMARIYSDRSDILDKVSKRYIEGITGLFPVLLKQACPHLSPSIINWRLAMANNANLQTLAELSKPPRHWLKSDKPDSDPSPAEIVEELKTFLVGAFKE